MAVEKQDIATVGRAMYEGVRSEMEASHWGRVVVLDVNTDDRAEHDGGRERGDRGVAVTLAAGGTSSAFAGGNSIVGKIHVALRSTPRNPARHQQGETRCRPTYTA